MQTWTAHPKNWLRKKTPVFCACFIEIIAVCLISNPRLIYNFLLWFVQYIKQNQLNFIVANVDNKEKSYSTSFHCSGTYMLCLTWIAVFLKIFFEHFQHRIIVINTKVILCCFSRSTTTQVRLSVRMSPKDPAS